MRARPLLGLLATVVRIAPTAKMPEKARRVRRRPIISVRYGLSNQGFQICNQVPALNRTSLEVPPGDGHTQRKMLTRNRRASQGTKEGSGLEHGDNIGSNLVCLLLISKVPKMFLKVLLGNDTSSYTGIITEEDNTPIDDKCEP
jgi:hypothetical protein